MGAVLDYEELAAARYEDGEGWLVEWLGGWELCDTESEAWASVALKCAGGLSEPSEYKVRPNVKGRERI